MKNDEKIKEIEKKDFDHEVKENIHKMMGCKKDHAVELDIYNKTYKEKIERIKMMKEQGNQAMEEVAKTENKEKQDENLNKASYYYAQALLIFVYLIPDNDAQEKESNELKISCHLNQSLCYMKLQRFEDSLKETQDVLHRLDPFNVKALYRKAQVLEM